MLDACVNHDAAQYKAIHELPMKEVLPRLLRWLEELKRLQDERKRARRRR